MWDILWTEYGSWVKSGILLVLLAAAAWMDSRSRRIPNVLPAAGLGVRLLLYLPEQFLAADCGISSIGSIGSVSSISSISGMGSISGIKGDFLRDMAEAALVLLALLAVRGVSRGGLGYGDIKLLAVAALYSGARCVLIGFCLGIVLAAPRAVVKLIRGGQRRERIALAPFLSCGILLALLGASVLHD